MSFDFMQLLQIRFTTYLYSVRQGNHKCNKEKAMYTFQSVFKSETYKQWEVGLFTQEEESIEVGGLGYT